MKTLPSFAKQNLKYNKSRSILITIAIFLSVTLLTLLFSMGIGILRYNTENVGILNGNYHARFFNIDESKIAILSHHSEIEQIGNQLNYATVETNQTNATLKHSDENYAKMVNLTLEMGVMPQKDNEIAAQKEFFSIFTSNPELGSSLKIPYRELITGEVLTKEFIISGILPSNEINTIQNSYEAYVSNELIQNSLSKEERIYISYLKMKTQNGASYDNVNDQIDQLAASQGISKNNYDINFGYLNFSTSMQTDTIIAIALIALLIVLFSTLVINNIFRVGIIQKITEYGKLRAIGCTKKQLKKLIWYEGFALTCISIPFGMVIGCIGASLGMDFLFYEVALTSTKVELVKISVISLPILLMIIAITLFMVFLSLRKPMKIATRISPLESMKYQEVNILTNQKRKPRLEMTLYQFIRSNISRNRKRTISTILTMGLSCVMFVIIANVMSSVRPEDYARSPIRKGDFKLSLNDSYDPQIPERHLNYLQTQHLMGSDFLDDLEQMEGVESIEVTKSIVVSMKDLDSTAKEAFGDFDSIEAMSRDDFMNLSKKLVRGEIDYDKASENNGVILTYDTAFEQLGFEIGDQIEFQLHDGDQIKPFTATLQGSTISADSMFVMTIDTLNKLDIDTDPTTRVYISCNSKSEAAISDKLKNLTKKNSNYRLTSYKEMLDEAEMVIMFTAYPLYGLFIILAVIGFMNLANTLITSIVTRKREFGMLQAIGMTGKQLNSMLQSEGLVFTIGTLIIALTLGNGLGYLAFSYAKTNGFLSINEYHFPFFELGAMVVLLVVFQLLLSWYMTRKMQKEALIERIRFYD